ncbi:MAG: T9SS type A sorting domain-containing protein [candidate division WOR-3 bacterium]|nr:T9SS type A sorting domain-containing protein [candidate division WOR-3 bacterium]
MRLDGRSLPSGIYFARLKTDSYEETKKIVLIK